MTDEEIKPDDTSGAAPRTGETLAEAQLRARTESARADEAEKKLANNGKSLPIIAVLALIILVGTLVGGLGYVAGSSKQGHSNTIDTEALTAEVVAGIEERLGASLDDIEQRLGVVEATSNETLEQFNGFGDELARTRAAAEDAATAAESCGCNAETNAPVEQQAAVVTPPAPAPVEEPEAAAWVAPALMDTNLFTSAPLMCETVYIGTGNDFTAVGLDSAGVPVGRIADANGGQGKYGWLTPEQQAYVQLLHEEQCTPAEPAVAAYVAMPEPPVEPAMVVNDGFTAIPADLFSTGALLLFDIERGEFTDDEVIYTVRSVEPPEPFTIAETVIWSSSVGYDEFGMTTSVPVLIPGNPALRGVEGRSVFDFPNAAEVNDFTHFVGYNNEGECNLPLADRENVNEHWAEALESLGRGMFLGLFGDAPATLCFHDSENFARSSNLIWDGGIAELIELDRDLAWLEVIDMETGWRMMVEIPQHLLIDPENRRHVQAMDLVESDDPAVQHYPLHLPREFGSNDLTIIDEARFTFFTSNRCDFGDTLRNNIPFLYSGDNSPVGRLAIDCENSHRFAVSPEFAGAYTNTEAFFIILGGAKLAAMIYLLDKNPSDPTAGDTGCEFLNCGGNPVLPPLPPS